MVKNVSSYSSIRQNMQRQFDDMCILTVEERARRSLNVPTLGMKRSHVGN